MELVPVGGDGFMGLFVSAVEDAGHFWIQVHGPNAIALEKLTDDMSAFYANSENQQKYTLEKVSCDCDVFPVSSGKDKSQPSKTSFQHYSKSIS